MKAYHDPRAPEYDERDEGPGRFDGLDRPRWDDEIGELLHAGRWFAALAA